MRERDPLVWRSAGRCEHATCVEVARRDGGWLVRQSTDPDGPVLEYTDAEWDAFLAGVKAGEFDA